MLTQHNRKTARLHFRAIRELGVWSGDETMSSVESSESTAHVQ